MVDKKEEKICCSFCGKDSSEVNKLIKGAYVYICDDCIHLCQEILDENIKDKNSSETHKKITPNKNPSAIELKNFVDEYVIGQEKAKKILSVSIINHFKRIQNPVIDGVELEKENVIIVGPSGTGKTAIVKTIAKKLRIPFAICDSTVLSEVGYVGADPETVVKKLLKNAGNDVSRAEHGIIFIDEIDKKSKKTLSSGTKDASGEGVQQALLKIMEGTIIDVEVPNKRSSETVKLDTSNILFIVAGAFSGIDEIVKKRINSETFGFTNQKLNKNIDDKIITSDIIEYGIIPELKGRIPIIAQVYSLSIEELREVLLNTKNSLIKQYEKLFEIDGITLIFEDSSIDYIVEQSFYHSTGVRGLRTIIEDKLMEIQYNIENIKKDGFNTITIDRLFFEGQSSPKYSYIDKTIDIIKICD